MFKQIFVRPVITEKSLARIKNSQYTFLVSKELNKYQIKDFVQKEYKVDVLKINTIIRKGKLKSVGKKRQIKEKPSRKFAIVEIKKDQKIGEFNQ